MSNSRIFCVAFSVWLALNLIAEMFGFHGSYAGVSAIVAKVMIGATWGVWAVAIFGDRASSTGEG